MNKRTALQQLTKEVYLEEFATWLEKEGYKAIGYNMWATTQSNYWGQPIYYTTEQLVKQFLKNNV